MSSFPVPGCLRALLTAGVGVLVLGTSAFGAAVLGASPANAHDELISNAPLDDAVLESAPESVGLSFNAEILDLGAAVIVVDASSTDHALGEPELAGTEVTQPVSSLPDGAYQVRWRVVSSDGHPIAGSFDFVVGDPADAAPIPAVGAVTPAQVDSDPVAGSDIERSGNEVPSSWWSSAPLWQLVAGGGILGLGIFVLVARLRRSRI